jgi:integrase
MRIGEALGLRHEDIAAAEREVTVFPRHNANGARTKSANTRTIPVSAEPVRLYADYLHEEYGDLDSGYVFVNLWGRPHGRPLAYPAVYDLVCRLRRQTGIDFDPHWYRHTTATRQVPRRRRDRGRVGGPRSRFDHHDAGGLWAFDQRGRPPGA